MALIHLENCPICGSQKLEAFLTVKDHSISHEQFKLLQCQDCSLVFTQNHPDASNIGRYYQSEDYISHSDTQEGLINRLYHQIRSLMLDKKKTWVEKHASKVPGSLLDVGCGTGYFVNHMKTGGWDVLGLEPDETARKVALDNFQLPLKDTSKLFQLDQKFDVITLWHVLEHVHELNRYIETFRQLLNENGLLLIAVPNYTSRDAKKYGSDWAAYDVPRHLWHFSPGSMHHLLEKHHFRILKKYGMMFDPFYVAMLSEKYKGSSLGTIRGGLAGLMSNFTASQNVDRSSSLIYIAKQAKV
jgi:SAM-dependent methyltransferase